MSLNPVIKGSYTLAAPQSVSVAASSSSSVLQCLWWYGRCSLRLHKRILISNVFIGLVTVPIYLTSSPP